MADINTTSTLDTDMDPNSSMQALYEIELEREQLMESRRPLKEEIQNAIAPYLTSLEKPPFTTAELVIMAIINSNREYVSNKDVLGWIVETFFFFTKLAAAEYAKKYDTDSDHYKELDMIIEGFHHVFTDYDIPFEGFQYDGWAYTRYNINPAAARVCLRRILEPERGGVFRLFDLPAELRNRVYDMLLQFPDSQIIPSRVGFGLECCACNSLQLEPQHAWHCESEFKHLRYSKLHSLFLVSQQAFHETMPIFYGSNMFRWDFRNYLDESRRLSDRQLRCLKKLTLAMGSLRKSLSSELLALLNQSLVKLPPLRELSLVMDDSSWMDRRWGPWRHYEEVPELEGLIEVAAKAKNLSFVRIPTSKSCEHYEWVIRKGVERIKAQVQDKYEEEKKVDIRRTQE